MMIRSISIAAFASVFSFGIANAQTVLKWGEHSPECCSMFSAAAKWMQQEVDQRSAGDLKFDIHFGGSLASVGEIPSAIENRVFEMGNLVTPYFQDQFIINNADPFMWLGQNSMQKISSLIIKWQEEIPAFSAELAQYNLKFISVRTPPAWGLLCTSPIRTIEDFKGKRIRSYGRAVPALLEALGAVPVGMVDVEAYEALKNNVLDCTVGDKSLIDAFRLEEVGKYFIDIPTGAILAHMVVMNVDVYNSLSDENKQIVEDLKQDHVDEIIRLYDENEKRIEASWASSGSVEIIEFPDDLFTNNMDLFNNAKVKEIRDGWRQRAIAAGLPEADADQVIADIYN